MKRQVLSSIPEIFLEKPQGRKKSWSSVSHNKKKKKKWEKENFFLSSKIFFFSFS